MVIMMMPTIIGNVSPKDGNVNYIQMTLLSNSCGSSESAV